MSETKSIEQNPDPSETPTAKEQELTEIAIGALVKLSNYYTDLKNPNQYVVNQALHLLWKIP